MEACSDPGLRVFQAPTVELAVEALREGFRKGELTIIIGCLRVDYHGRARSKLGFGERIAILKPDGALLIHRPRGHSPVNWQPPGSKFDVKSSDGKVVIDAERSNPFERVTLTFNRIDLLVSSRLKDEAEFSLYVDEHDIRDALVLEPDLFEDGFRIITKEKKVPSGFVDLFGVDKRGRLTVIEVKKGVAGRESLIQLKRYIDDLKRRGDADLRGVILASGLAKGCRGLMESLGLEFKRVNSKRCYEALMRHRREGFQLDLSRWFRSS
ncbi:MAG: endonuclease NucS [Candidatus Bathyarchaeia archaeon]|nr:endonuclease NucS [Candidatus Bathyarchaeota archaeon]